MEWKKTHNSQQRLNIYNTVLPSLSPESAALPVPVRTENKQDLANGTNDYHDCPPLSPSLTII